ncbi:hypothetical protein L3X38_011922 [Prunus dulcis]|uniref:Uncharacterized protein n=1 Tax=Prunus dulcis TaxID=3755 RepID=A0AAD4WIB9_PRUDU|nr:hypothetical protein L3X38_011922 [Prunus dulcis]
MEGRERLRKGAKRDHIEQEGGESGVAVLGGEGNVMQGEDEKLEFPQCVGPVYDSYNDDKKGDYHSDDQDNSDVKDELYLLPS